jgi:hypothetical protein
MFSLYYGPLTADIHPPAVPQRKYGIKITLKIIKHIRIIRLKIEEFSPKKFLPQKFEDFLSAALTLPLCAAY